MPSTVRPRATFAGIAFALSPHGRVPRPALFKILLLGRAKMDFTYSDDYAFDAARNAAAETTPPTAEAARKLRRDLIRGGYGLGTLLERPGGRHVAVMVGANERWSVYEPESAHERAALKRRRKDLERLVRDALPRYCAAGGPGRTSSPAGAWRTSGCEDLLARCRDAGIPPEELDDELLAASRPARPRF